MKITAVIAMDHSCLIGSKNGLPWHIPEDLKRFKSLTEGGVVIMGKNTYFSIPEKYRPLPGRRNIVLARSSIEGVEVYRSIEELLIALGTEHVESAFLIGGASLYNQFFEKGIVDRVELTLVDGDHEGDIFVQEFRQDFHETDRMQFEHGVFLTLDHH